MSDHSIDEKGVTADGIQETYLVGEHDPDKVIARRFGRFGGVLERMFASGVEARGVERVPEDQRTARNVWNK